MFELAVIADDLTGGMMVAILRSSNKVKNIYSKEFKSLKNKRYYYLFDKKNISNILFPPLVSLCSIFLISTALIYFYDSSDNTNKSLLLNTKNKLISIKSINKLV